MTPEEKKAERKKREKMEQKKKGKYPRQLALNSHDHYFKCAFKDSLCLQCMSKIKGPSHSISYTILTFALQQEEQKAIRMTCPPEWESAIGYLLVTEIFSS